MLLYNNFLLYYFFLLFWTSVFKSKWYALNEDMLFYPSNSDRIIKNVFHFDVQL